MCENVLAFSNLRMTSYGPCDCSCACASVCNYALAYRKNPTCVPLQSYWHPKPYQEQCLSCPVLLRFLHYFAVFFCEISCITLNLSVLVAWGALGNIWLARARRRAGCSRKRTYCFSNAADVEQLWQWC